jgi:hypothetical protein|tara:strand:- start:11177 stop:11419 length:243 start_codon:yes stop_codon:yes gene_type:complete
MVNRKIGTVFTTISILWEDKDEFRKFAKYLKKTKNGNMYESDAALFKRMLELFKQHEQANEKPNNTYPRKSTSQERDLQG